MENLSNKTEAVIALVSAGLVLVSAIVNPVISIVVAVGAMFGFGVVKLLRGEAVGLVKSGLAGLVAMLAAMGLAMAIMAITNEPSPSIEAPDQIKIKGTAEQLKECMVASDMASRQQCDQILSSIVDFKTCVEAGVPVMESYPRSCRLPDGRLFEEVVTEEEAVFCTMDALICPDGSYVGRVGPNCEFAPCPGE